MALYKHEMKIIGFIHVNGSAKKGDLIRFYGISQPAEGEELTQMIKLNLIRIEGKLHSM